MKIPFYERQRLALTAEDEAKDKRLNTIRQQLRGSHAGFSERSAFPKGYHKSKTAKRRAQKAGRKATR